MMSAPRPPYPSIAQVLTGAENLPIFATDNSRLPSYRESHLRRYHPYPRSAPPVAYDRLMTTVDYRFDEPRPAQLVDAGYVVINLDDDHSSEEDALNLEAALSVPRRHELARRVSFPSLVVDLAAAVKLQCRRIIVRTRSQSELSHK